MKKNLLIVFTLILFAIGAKAQEPSRQTERQPAPLQTERASFTQVMARAENGEPDAMLTMGTFHEYGTGLPKNFTLAMEWYAKAAEAGLPEGWYNLGICYEIGMGNPGDVEKAVLCFERAAALGLVPAMEKLSSIYFAGKYLPQDNSKGLSWLKKAGSAGAGTANNTLGLIYLHGLLGQKKNEAKAFEYFMKAADAGFLEAIKNIGRLYKDGLGRKKNPAEALKWYLIAQMGGDKSQNLDLILSDLKGTFKPIDLVIAEKEAANWLKGYLERKEVH